MGINHGFSFYEIFDLFIPLTDLNKTNWQIWLKSTDSWHR